MMMEGYAKGVSKYPKISIIIVIIITFLALFSIQIFGINQDFSEESFMPDMEMAKASEEISEKFTTTRSVSILVKSNNNNVLTTDNLVEMLQIEKEILNDSLIISSLENSDIPSINVNSVADIISQIVLQRQGNFNPSIDEKILAVQNMNNEEIKQTTAEFLKSSDTSDDVKYIFQLMLTKDFKPNNEEFTAKGTLITVSLNESKVTQSEEKMDELVKKTNLKSTKMTVMGENIIMNEILDANNESMAILLPLAFGLVIVILAIVYRNALDMLFSILALGFAIIWVYGFGAAMGYSFNPMTTAVPVLIVGLGIDYGIHITMRYREEIKSVKNIEKAIIITIMSVGMALLLATVTTVVSFLSNLASPLSLLAEFGILSAVGIIGSFITMTTFVPAIKQLRDNRKVKKGKFEGFGKNHNSNNKKHKIKSAGVKVLDKAMGSGSTAAEHHPTCVIVIVTVVTIGSLGLALQLDTTFDFNEFLPDDLEITKDLNYFMDEFEIVGGEGEEVNILIQGDIADPVLLNDLDKTIENMKNDESVIQNNYTSEPKVESVLSVMYEWATNTSQSGFQDSNYDENFELMYFNYFSIEGKLLDSTKKEDLVTLYDWLYTNPLSTKSIKNVLYRNEKNTYESTVLRISVDVESENSDEIKTLQNQLDADKKPLDGSSSKAIVTGGPILTQVIMDSLNESQIRSLIITIIISLIVLTIVFWYKWRSILLGAITVTPVVFCVAWTLGTMYLVNIPLNMMTITIASLTIGLGITYGIHITHRFLEDLQYYNSKNNIEIKRTVKCPKCGKHLHTSGKPGNIIKVTCSSCGEIGKVTFKNQNKTTSFIDEACYSTVTHTGTALFGAATTTIAGFGLLVFALMPPLQQFGAITALTILFSFLSSVFVLPTFLVIWAKKRQKLKNKKKSIISLK